MASTRLSNIGSVLFTKCYDKVICEGIILKEYHYNLNQLDAVLFTFFSFGQLKESNASFGGPMDYFILELKK